VKEFSAIIRVMALISWQKIGSLSPYLNVDVEMWFWKDTSGFLAKNWTSTLSDGGRGGIVARLTLSDFSLLIILIFYNSFLLSEIIKTPHK